MKFSDLDDFVNNQMDVYHDKHFQQVVISTLIQNGGKATIDELKEQVLKYHPDSNFDIGHASIGIITNPVSRKQKVLYNGQTIAKRTSGTIEILDYDTYAIEEKAKLIVDCILRIKEKKEYLEDSIESVRHMIQHMPELKTDKEEVLKKYGNMFSLKNIDKLTPEKFKEFLRYDNNRHWTVISRDSGNKITDMPKLKKTLKILVDETIPIEDRIKQIRNEKRLGKATFSAVLLVASQLKHAVVNNIVVGFPGALERLGFITEKQSKKHKEWEFLLLAQKIVEFVAKKYQFDLWQIDWVWYDIVHKRDLGKPPKYWLIKPGADNAQKEEFLKESFIEIGYMGLFLPKYFNRDGEKSPNHTKFRETAKKKLKDAAKSDTPENISFHGIRFMQFMEMAKGDVIVLWDGSSNVFAKGKVDGRYQYNSDHRHQRAVVWEEVEDKQIPKESQIGPTKPAIFPLKDPQNYPEAVSPLYKWLFGDTSKTSTMSSPPKSADYQEDLALLEWEKNLILYGPPGTGKTYHANKIAEEKTANNPLPPELDPAVLDRATSDDFRGIVIKFISDQCKLKNYEFKEVKKNFLYSLAKDGKTIHIDIHLSDPETPTSDCYVGMEQAKIDFLRETKNDNDRYMIIINHGRKNFVVLPYKIEQRHAQFTGRGTSGSWDPTGITTHSFHIDISENSSYFRGTNYNCDKYVRNIRQIFDEDFVKTITFHQSFSYEEFIEGIKPEVIADNGDSEKTFINYDVKPGIFKKFCAVAESNPKNNYVMIIDEINRGNISKIFGELITVIEKDKRGKTVTLPYSGDTFHVPENVYVIGTMNTADRSIAKIDTALSRRFGRREIMPDSSVLKDKKVEGINLTELLDKLNGKIKVNHRDRQIGHSYLMDGNSAIDNISDLRLAFLYDIIPLLKELTFEDEKELKDIIGNHFIDYKTKNIKEKMTDDEFEKEMKSFLNSDPKENEPEEKGGDETDAEET